MKFKKIAVIGSGTMGNGIAQVMAVAGRDVALIDVAAPALGKAMGTIEKSLGKLVERSSPRRTRTPRWAGSPRTRS